MTTAAIKVSSMRPALQLVLPKEHGSWSLALEPLMLGLLIAPSSAGAALALAAASGFFLRRPLKVFSRESNSERLRTARFCLFVLTGLAVFGLSLAAKLGGTQNLWPLLPAALAGLVFAWADSRNEARENMAEIAGAVAFSILPAAFATLAGWNLPTALALAAMALTRSVPTVLTVRTRLRMAKKQPVVIWPAILAAVTGLVLMLWLTMQNFAPWLTTIFAVVFAMRTLWLLVLRPSFTARQIGIMEAVLGGLMVIALAVVW